jgi:hypothetical protein
MSDLSPLDALHERAVNYLQELADWRSAGANPDEKPWGPVFSAEALIELVERLRAVEP